MKKYVYFWILLIILMHLVGSLVKIDEVRLYDYWVAGILKYDLLVHFINSFFMAVILSKLLKIKRWQIVLIVIGIGALYEIVELFCVIMLDSQGVGSYINNAFDNVFNTLGAVMGGFLLKRKETS